MEYLTASEVAHLGTRPPITKARFKTIWEMRPVGNPSNAYIAVCRAIMHHITFEGNKITIEFLEERWKNYLEYCRLTQTDEKYIKFLENWTEKEGYHATYDLSSLKNKLETYTKPNDDRRPARHRGEPETLGDDQ